MSQKNWKRKLCGLMAAIFLVSEMGSTAVYAAGADTTAAETVEEVTEEAKADVVEATEETEVTVETEETEITEETESTEETEVSEETEVTEETEVSEETEVT
uniref:hypothetical protein n=1 Tax=Roseburia sp. TaxID=2049040 RepID=UPI003FEF8435